MGTFCFSFESRNMVTVDYMADDGGDTYQEAIPDWVFYPAAVVALGLVAWVIYLVILFQRTSETDKRLEQERLQKRLEKKKDAPKKRVPVAGVKKSSDKLKRSPKP